MTGRYSAHNMKKMVIICVLLFIISSGCVTEEKPTMGKRTDVNATSAHSLDKEVNWIGMDEEKTAKMVPVELPVFQEVDYYMGGYIPTWAVMKDAPNRDEGIRLLMFWSTPLVAEKWVRYAKAPTGMLGHVSTSDSADDPFEQFQAVITEKYGGNVHYSANAGYIFGEEKRLLQDDLNKKILRLLDGEVTAEQAYE